MFHDEDQSKAKRSKEDTNPSSINCTFSGWHFHFEQSLKDIFAGYGCQRVQSACYGSANIFQPMFIHFITIINTIKIKKPNKETL